MLVSRSYCMFSAAPSGYPRYAVRPAGGVLPVTTNVGVVVLAGAVYQVDLELSPGPYTIVWEPGDGSTDAEDFQVPRSFPTSFTDAAFAAPGVFSAEALANAPVGSGSGGSGPSAGAMQAACAAAIVATPVKLTLTQPLADTTAGTVGGALHGSWALAWGRVVLDPVNRILAVFGAFSTTIAARRFSVNRSDAPTFREPLP